MTGQSFNSTLVQLKDWNYEDVTAKVPLFQFYLSSIKSSRSMIYRLALTCTGFNSTLVQLKAVKNANKYTSKSMIYHPFILIFYKHLQSTFNS